MLPAGAYVIVTGATLTADEASAGIFPPDADVVHVHTEQRGRTVAYTYLIDYREEPPHGQEGAQAKDR